MKPRAQKRWLHHAKAAHGVDVPFLDADCEDCRTLAAAAGAKVPPRTEDQRFGIDLDFQVHWRPEGVRFGVQDDPLSRAYFWTLQDHHQFPEVWAVLDREEAAGLHAALGRWLGIAPPQVTR